MPIRPKGADIILTLNIMALWLAISKSMAGRELLQAFFENNGNWPLPIAERLSIVLNAWFVMAVFMVRPALFYRV